jgi:amino acid adenylation domain-containing protein
MKQQPLLNEKDRHKLLYEFNDTKAEYPRDKVLQELFEEQVEKTPNNLSLIFKGKKLTYRQLNERSNQLARRLKERGVNPDQIVGLMVDDSPIEMILGIISILKAGGAFLPIDPEYPKDRIEYMMEDSNVGLLLTQTNLKDKIHFEGEVINLENQSLFTRDSSNLGKINQSNDLAYVIYTSGSTGKPKGVQIEHTSIVNQIYGLEKIYTFDSSLHHILLAPFTFDPSVQQIFLPLTSGGKLFLVSKSSKYNMAELSDFVVSNHIDILNTVPSLMNVLLDQINGYDDLHFKYIILAGEVFTKNLYLRLRESLSAEKIVNIYGPTEATINTTLYECKLEEANSTIPIGKPLMNYNVFILDEHQNLLPIGVPAEICISGVGLTRGYLNNPELTAEKFVANPFTPGERIYRTGDLGRWTADGNIEFLGRIDHQVKVRGFRVEPGEVETVLGQHPAVREAVVIDQEDHSGNTRLVAYIVLNQEQTLPIGELRSFLKENLPDYMVPSAFVMLDALPLTPNGKVDRRALPVPDQVRRDPEKDFVPPRDELEYQLTRIWEKILDTQPIGVNDDFFELGGNSLAAAQVFAKLEKNLGVKLPLATLFQAPTIEQLSNILSKEGWKASWSSLVAIQSRGSKPPLFLVHAAGGNVLMYRELALHLGPDQPLYGLQAQGLDGRQPFITRVEEMASHYIEAIKTVQGKGPYFLGGYCLGGTIALEMAQQLHAKNDKVALLALFETLNWANSKAESFFNNVQFYLEKTNFHLRNFLLLSPNEKITFLQEELYSLKSRKDVWSGMLLSKFRKSLQFRNSTPLLLSKLWKVNYQAALHYEPKIYPGRIVHFQPIKEYSLYNFPASAWEGLAAGGIKTYKLNVYPGAMMVEPFVRDTAKTLKACLDRELRNMKLQTDINETVDRVR